MQVAVSIRRAVIIDDNVDAFDIDSTAKNISGDQNTLFKGFERRVTTDSVMSQKCK